MQRRPRTKPLLLALLACAVLSTSASASTLAVGDERVPDRVELANGTRVEGRIVFEDDSKILLLTGTGEKTFEKKSVKSSRSRARLHDGIFERWLALDPDQLPAILDLMRACKQTDLLEDAECFANRALLLDRKNADAHKLLGHRKRGSGFDFEFRKDRWTSFDQVFVARPDWDQALDVASMHYVVRTNFALESAVASALDLECFYRAFFVLFGKELELREVVDPMTVEIHADRGSFPQLASSRTAYVEPVRNWVEIDASGGTTGGADRQELFHEATHQLIAALTHLSFSGAGEVPGWLNEGLAEYLAAGMNGPPGQKKFSEGALLLDHFKVHAAAKSPYDLSRVLTFEAGDFIASSKSDLKYAQAYTLVQFCMEGDSGEHRAGFLDFLRAVWRGKRGSADFRKALKIEGKVFEKAWTEHVRANAH